MILLQLYLSFFQIGLFAFGGGYAAVPLIQQQIVETRGWLEMSQFADLITISEMTPGPIIINCATFVGNQVCGFWGAVIATLGSVTPSILIVLLLSWVYMKFRSLWGIQGILTGLRPAIVALIASAGLSLLLLALFPDRQDLLHLGDFHPLEGLLFCVSLFLLRKRLVSPIAVIFGSGLIGALVYALMGQIPH